jgi:ribonuclease HI
MSQLTLFNNHNSEPDHQIILAVNANARNNSHSQYRKAAIGYTIEEGDERIAEASEYLGKGKKYTNNYGEYRAVINGIQEVKQQRVADQVHLQIRTSSKLLLNHLINASNVNKMKKQYNTCMEELRAFCSWEPEYVSEEPGNCIDRADNLADAAFKR